MKTTKQLLVGVMCFFCVWSVLGAKLQKQDSNNTCGGFRAEGSGTCAKGMFCNYKNGDFCGAADAPGTCTTIPEACAEIYDPVCGCDGKTYPNQCKANANSTSVSYLGECNNDSSQNTTTDSPSSATQKLGDPCGALRGVGNLICDKGLFCNYAEEDACGFADAPGVCATIPEVCTREYAPVCGCDGQTHSTACVANSRGIAVQYKGQCQTPTLEEGQEGASCGGNRPEGSAVCAKGMFCNYAPEDICGAADATGRCTIIPEVCTKIYDPVCGCDGQTYGNPCEALSNSVSILHHGTCSDSDGTTSPQDGEMCGGIAAIRCKNDKEACFYRPFSCGRADQSGVCAAIPDFCPELYRPVCGCDNIDYSNDCVARRRGVSVLSYTFCNGTLPPPGNEPTTHNQTESSPVTDQQGRAASQVLQRQDTCTSNQQCGSPKYCKFEVGSCSFRKRARDTTTSPPPPQGKCVVRRKRCRPPTTTNQVVCGCDGNEYPSKCHAGAAGVSISKKGPC